MKAQSSNRPPSYTVEQCGDIAEVVLYENIVELEDGYAYDEYRLNVPWRDDLSESVEANIEVWIEAAKANETVLAEPTLMERIEAIEGAILEGVLYSD